MAGADRTPGAAVYSVDQFMFTVINARSLFIFVQFLCTLIIMQRQSTQLSSYIFIAACFDLTVSHLQALQIV